jgi:hypothetical protein
MATTRVAQPTGLERLVPPCGFSVRLRAAGWGGGGVRVAGAETQTRGRGPGSEEGLRPWGGKGRGKRRLGDLI